METILAQFHFLAYIWVRVETHYGSSRTFRWISWISSRIAEGCEKWEDQLTRLLEKQQQIFLMVRLRKKYLGNICTQKGCSDKKIIFYFFLSRSKLQNKYRIIFLCDQPFMFFVNKSTNFWQIWQKNIWNEALVVLHHLKKVWRFLDHIWKRNKVFNSKTFYFLNFPPCVIVIDFQIKGGEEANNTDWGST